MKKINYFKNKKLNNYTIIFFILIFSTSIAQNTNYELANGINFNLNDNSYNFNISGMIQPYILSDFGNKNQDTDLFMGSKRNFLSFGVNSINDKTSSYFLVDFSSESPLLEAWISYKAIENLTLTFGQTKNIGNNREMLINEQDLPFVDRGMLSDSLNETGREFGFSIHYFLGNQNFAVIPSIQITSGDGKNSFGSDSRDVDLGGLKYSARIDFYPIGLFKEGELKTINDFNYEEKLKLLIGAAGSYNDGASHRVGEGHGEFFLYDLLSQILLPDYRELNFDIVSKFKGFSFLGEYSISTANGLENLFTTQTLSQELSPTEISRFLSLGRAYSSQLFYTHSSGYSLGYRYSKICQEFDNNLSILSDMNKNSLILSKSMKNNSLKIMGSFNIFEFDGNKNFSTQLALQLLF